MGHCLCCTGKLLRHIRHQDVYWYCPNCRQSMPDTRGLLVEVHSAYERKPLT